MGSMDAGISACRAPFTPLTSIFFF